MSAHDDKLLAVPPLRWGPAGLRTDAAPQLRWLWHGYLATGAVSLLTSQWKIGKTTLLSILLARMKAGGTLAGLPVTAGRAVIITEESTQQWLLRSHRLDLDDHIGWFCRPFRGRPRPEQWQALLDRVSEVAAEREVSLLVVDPLAAFFPGKSENDAAAMLDALAPLQALAARGLSVLALHHPAKRDNSDGPSGRGSGALLGCADILIEMRGFRRPTDEDRRRRLLALSRFDETPRELVIELNAEGPDYVARGNFADEEFAAHWRLIEDLLRQAECKLSRDDILAAWPAEERPDAITLYRWLRRAVEQGLLRQDGLGKCKSPFRYWLPASEERWREDPLALIRMPELFRQHPE
jgi:hypothetical protein